VQDDVESKYTLGNKIGEGQFGVTRYVYPKAGKKEPLACKSISKLQANRPADMEAVRREIEILKEVGAHPNVPALVHVFEDTDCIHLVQELCTGGELFDRIIERGSYSERDAARIVKTMIEVVSYCHAQGVIHRDLKPENFLFKTNKERQDPSQHDELMAIDFGLSVRYRQGDVFADPVGSPYYIAPEVLRRSYTEKCDVWSVGVVMYILLTGEPPFGGANTSIIFENIRSGQLNMRKLAKVSEEARNLIQGLLNRDIDRRLTADQAKSHSWLSDGEASDLPLDLSVVEALKRFDATTKFRKLTLLYMSTELKSSDLQKIKKEFDEADIDKNGQITLDELQRVLERNGKSASAAEVEKLMKAMDMDGNGKIMYRDWIAATLKRRQVLDEEALLKAFRHFDVDDSGTITKDELAQCMEDSTPEEIETLVKQVDVNGDGQIDYGEFVRMMHAGIQEARVTL